MPSLALDRQAHERFERILERLATADRRLRKNRIRAAFEYLEKTCSGKTHWSGCPLVLHSVGVLETLLPFRPDEDAIVGCLLQHTLEDQTRTLDEVQSAFGENVRSIVSGVHLLSHVTLKNRRMSMDHLRLMFLQVSDDMRVILITLCAQSYVLNHIDESAPDLQRRICRDSLSLFAPVAARLGIYSLKNSLEARAFPVAYPTDSERIVQQVQDIHRQYGNFLHATVHELEQFLKTEGVEARIEAREKQPYSIFRKMQDKSIGHVSELFDLFALRIIVKDEAMCYQMLGLLHRIGHPVPHRFKDYISFPKPNGYQSLHTTLARLPGMPEKLRVEVQIRTEAMHRDAEYGIAAHWSYKHGDEAHAKTQLSRALAFQQAIERGKSSALSDYIFVLTPKGDIIELPEGSTPLDFAFQVHTNLGLSFRAARVNGAVVPLMRQLENGDIVEILRYREPRPSSRWSTLLKTASARSRLKRYLSEQHTADYVSLGKDLINQELDERGEAHLGPDLSLLRSVEGNAVPVSERETWIAKVGEGSLKAAALLDKLDVLKPAKPAAPKKRPTGRIPKTTGELTVHSEIPMPTRYAKCCKPEEAKKSPIVGIVSRTGEVRVHRSQCAMIKKGNPGRRVKVKWM